MGAIAVGWLALTVISQSAAEEDDATPLFLTLIIIPYVLYAVPRAMRTREIRTNVRNLKRIMKVVGATAGVLYVELFLLLLAWHPAGVSERMLHTLGAYFYPLTLMLRLIGIETWLSG
ncbi:MAG: hypothetical protein ACYTKD_14975 [Planctomycetota bacterium]